MQVLKTSSEEYKHLCEVFDLMGKYGISFGFYDGFLVSFDSFKNPKMKNMRLVDSDNNCHIVELPSMFEFKVVVKE